MLPPTVTLPPIVALFVTIKLDTETSPVNVIPVKLAPLPKYAEAQTLLATCRSPPTDALPSTPKVPVALTAPVDNCNAALVPSPD